MRYPNIREEELKNKVGQDFFTNFMSQFIAGKIKQAPKNDDLFSQPASTTHSGFETLNGLQSNPLQFSEKAQAVFNAGRELWRYYHLQPAATTQSGFQTKTQSGFQTLKGLKTYNTNASLYDIREHFQGRNDKGKMNNKSSDQTYMKLITELRESLKILAKKIEPKVYEYGFLKE